MKEITLKLYEYDELSDEAKKKALEDWRSPDAGHQWDGEIRDTLKALEKELDIEVFRWSYDSCGHDSGSIIWGTRWNDDNLALAGERARSFLWNNFARLVMQPRKKWYAKHIDGRIDLSGCIHCDDGWTNLKRKSKVFFDRVYDGTCPLTGVCFDNDALDPLAYFCFGVKWDEDQKTRVMVPHDERWRWKSTTVEEIIRDCVDSLFKAAQEDWESQLSEEYFKDYCVENEWLFEEDGTRRARHEEVSWVRQTI